MSFRPATADDEEFFWAWRQQAEQAAWYEGPPTDRDEHHAWFEDRVSRVMLLVWLYKGKRTGIVRAESNGEIAFDTSPKLAVAMLEEFRPYAAWYDGRLKATVDRGDPKGDALEQAGFTESPVRFFTYRP